MQGRRESLDEIGLSTRTDKASCHHDYLRFYEQFLERRRDDSLTILEVGVHGGASVQMWRRYFTKARIIGADIDPACRAIESDQISIAILDQGNIQDLVSLGRLHGPFDLIVEDGSHRWDHQVNTLRTLFPFLKDDGIYVVEDLQTNFGPDETHYRGSASISCIDYLKKATDICVSGVSRPEIEDFFLRTYAPVMTLSFYPGCCLILKRAGSQSRLLPDVIMPSRPASSTTAGRALVVLEAHIGEEGDVNGLSGSAQSKTEIGNIEGITLHCHASIGPAIEYRVKLVDDTWTPWVGVGRFAGTRGLSRGLKGVSVRWSAHSVYKGKLCVSGLFRGETNSIVVSSGEDCVSPSGGALYGLEIQVMDCTLLDTP